MFVKVFFLTGEKSVEIHGFDLYFASVST